jgi:L-fuculose-phosphate aldolase
MPPSNPALRDQIVQAARLLFRAGVMSHSGHANLSARLPGGDRMLLTARGQVADLTPDDLAVVSFDGDVLEGEMDAVAREIIGMHACVYRARPGAGGVIHTHSPRATVFAVAHQPLPCVYEAFLRFGITDDIPVAAWAPRGSPESIAAIQARLEQCPTTPAVLLANHGLLAAGADPLHAAQIVIAMEEAADLTLHARQIGGERPFPAGALARERAHMARFGSSG